LSEGYIEEENEMVRRQENEKYSEEKAESCRLEKQKLLSMKRKCSLFVKAFLSA